MECKLDERQLISLFKLFQLLQNFTLATRHQLPLPSFVNSSKRLVKENNSASWAKAWVKNTRCCCPKEARAKVSPRELFADGLGEPGSEGDTYQKMLVANTRTIVEGLGGKYSAFKP
ncbi:MULTISPECIES: hypothetical protein [unclassified Microcoleus]|uniref:hypothetical protein n=1 Tax=unclassified Microcoleus TaxID=2642155 RepID=UPI002FD3AFD5